MIQDYAHPSDGTFNHTYVLGHYNYISGLARTNYIHNIYTYMICYECFLSLEAIYVCLCACM